MTFAQWRSFYGWCGHQHVPENVHGDPGSLPWAAIATMARDLVTPPQPPEPPTPGPDPDFFVAEISGLWDADDDAWKQAIANAAYAGATVILVTETTIDGRMKRVCPAGWDFARLDRHPGESECTIMWKKSARRPASPAYPTVLSETKFYTGHGHLRPFVTSVTQALEDLKDRGEVDVFQVLHAPSGRTEPREAAHQETLAAIPEGWDVARKRHPDAGRVLGMDLNRNLRVAEYRQAWDEAFPMLELCYTSVGIPDWGTHGDALIDLVAAGKGRLRMVSVRRLPKVGEFDHRGIIVGVARVRRPA
jgi:hypothetical protein